MQLEDSDPLSSELDEGFGRGGSSACHIVLAPDVWLESWQLSKALSGQVDGKSSSMCTDHSNLSKIVLKEKIAFVDKQWFVPLCTLHAKLK